MMIFLRMNHLCIFENFNEQRGKNSVYYRIKIMRFLSLIGERILFNDLCK